VYIPALVCLIFLFYRSGHRFLGGRVWAGLVDLRFFVVIDPGPADILIVFTFHCSLFTIHLDVFAC
jgi:hypothetical protein